MKKHTLAMVLGMAASLMLSTASFAGEDRPDFATLDANQDGSLSADEAAADPTLSANWSAVDTDESGAVDQAEFSAFESMRNESTGESPAESQ